ncbi:non-ribosomal peptide synthetase [Streptomyces botrytidirepellens]|uniref:Phenyloxazoline synthase MbtB n=1 Tax=Streptomyces botrytidirepellens TaxID=2486417 RepID=A0A3M8X6K4_9ACTN|nr:non-ribosomal peptide synthetase [Streptomyces botrytidirepellens]RNG36053.1 amino acid adenylation domain-containing protein [Streptomyces botrytidirepellens]
MSQPARTDSALEHVTDYIAEVLGTQPAHIAPETPLTALGLESFTAVRLRRRIRERTGHDLPLTAFLGNAAAKDLAARLSERTGGETSHGDTAPTPAPAPAAEPFPLTAIQESYLVGREEGFVLGGVATFYYYEYDRLPPSGDPVEDVARLEAAWNRLVEHHPMLRMIVDDRGHQRVLPFPGPYRIGVTDLRDASQVQVAETLATLRYERSHQVRPAGQWPLFDLHAAFLPDGRTRLHVGIDVLVTDMAGWMLLIRQWGRLLANPAHQLPEPPTDFATLLREQAASPAWAARRERDRAYWAVRAADLPPSPRLPVLRDPASIEPPRFTRHAGGLTAAEWQALRARCSEHGVTPTAALLAAFAVILGRWGAGERICLNTTLFDRPDEPEGIERIVGDFTTTALVATPRFDPASWSGFTAYAADLNHRFWEDLDHRSVSGVEVLRDLGHTGGTPPYPIVFTSGVGLSGDEGPSAAWIGEEVFGVSQTPQVLLDHIVWDEGGALRIAWDAVDDAFPSDYVPALLASYVRLLRRLTDATGWKDPGVAWDPFVLSEDPLDVTPFPDAGPLLHDPAAAAARRDPDRPALHSGSGTTTHGRLAQNAAATAALLTAQGVGPGDLVAVACEKGPAQVAAVLAVNSCGAGYLPVEPSWPQARIAAACARAGIRHALVGRGVRAGWPEDVTVHGLTAAGRPRARQKAEEAGRPDEPGRPASDCTAYVIFTSGSSGTPKGVEIQHRAARTTIDDVVDRFGIEAEDRVLALSALSFDLSVFDIYGVLGAGGSLVLPDPARQRDPQHWLELAHRHGVTVWNTAPALLEMLVEYAEIEPEAATAALGDLRLVMLSGDWIPLPLPDRLRRLAPQARIMSLGGATEASIWSITYPVGDIAPQWRSIPYGRALRAQSFHILDERGGPCPVGEPGELFIGGDGLARGYIGDPEQSAARFAPHPVLGTRLYRTGDLGQWRTDGTIEFLGRADRQVKIRGHRIELGEIEAVLSRHPGIRQCVVSSVPGPDDRPRLVAYLAPKGSQAAPPTEELTQALRERLPDYMVPSRFVVLEALPVTANGKIDHAALKNPYRTDEVPTVEGPPATVPPPQATPATPSAAPPAMAWADSAVAEAAALGLETALVVRPGRLSPADALAASARWLERIREITADSDSAWEERFPADGLVQIALRTPTVVPEGTGTTASAPTADRSASPSGRTSPPRETATDILPVADPAVTDAVATILADLTGGPVEAGSTFTSLGATSLTLVLTHRRLRESIAPRLSLADMFEHATVASLATHITGLRLPDRTEGGETPAVPTAPVSTRLSSRVAARARAHEVGR